MRIGSSPMIPSKPARVLTAAAGLAVSSATFAAATDMVCVPIANTTSFLCSIPQNIGAAVQVANPAAGQASAVAAASHSSAASLASWGTGTLVGAGIGATVGFLSSCLPMNDRMLGIGERLGVIATYSAIGAGIGALGRPIWG